MNVKRMRILATEIFKIINNINPSFMKDIFTSKVNPKVLLLKGIIKPNMEQKVLQL